MVEPPKTWRAVTVDAALAHPTWSMGPKITIDSSTLMNKGLEVIEAHELYGTPYDQIDVVVHPQSVVHSMVEFTDGSTIAQLSMPDMRLPIGYALGYPNRIASPFGAIDWTTLGRLDFEPPDRAVFRCLDLAYEAGRIGGTAPAWLSAANEVAVDEFLAGTLRWNEIPDLCVGVMERHDGVSPDVGRRCDRSRSDRAPDCDRIAATLSYRNTGNAHDRPTHPTRPARHRGRARPRSLRRRGSTGPRARSWPAVQ